MTRIISRLVDVVACLKLNEENLVGYYSTNYRQSKLPRDMKELGTRECSDININLLQKALSLELNQVYFVKRLLYASTFLTSMHQQSHGTLRNTSIGLFVSSCTFAANIVIKPVRMMNIRITNQK